MHAATTAYPGYPERIELICTRGMALVEGTALKVRWVSGENLDFSTDAEGGGTGADPWPSPTTGTGASSPTSSTPSTKIATPRQRYGSL